MVYVFRTELYDAKGTFIMNFEEVDQKHGTYANSEHYRPIASSVGKSMIATGVGMNAYNSGKNVLFVQHHSLP